MSNAENVDYNRLDRQAIYHLSEQSEQALVTYLLKSYQSSNNDKSTINNLTPQVNKQTGLSFNEKLVLKFPLDTEAGKRLMGLAQALLRISDPHTADDLINDKLAGHNWLSCLGHSDCLSIKVACYLLQFFATHSCPEVSVAEKNRVNYYKAYKNSFIRRVLKSAVSRFSQGYVFAKNIEAAIAVSDRKAAEEGGLYSFDMLSESARSPQQAERNFQTYKWIIVYLGSQHAKTKNDLTHAVSVKLSALHHCYEQTNQSQVMEELYPRLRALVSLAKSFDLVFTIDAEEARRLEISLDLIEHLVNELGFEQWQGFSLSVQAYQKRALGVIQWCNALCEQHKIKLKIKLVKGEYWQQEINRAQQYGLNGYPVFTDKHNTELNYRLCIAEIFKYKANLYGQFATHNTETLSFLFCYVRSIGLSLSDKNFELQRLYGRAERLHTQVLQQYGLIFRINSPLAGQSELLACLARRIIESREDGAHLSICLDKTRAEYVELSEQCQSWCRRSSEHLLLPRKLYGKRLNALGIDVHDPRTLSELLSKLQSLNFNTLFIEHDIFGELLVCKDKNSDLLHQDNRAKYIASHCLTDQGRVLVYIKCEPSIELTKKCQALVDSSNSWSQRSLLHRQKVVLKFADEIENEHLSLLYALVNEAGKTIPGAINEIREAVNICRYYAEQASVVEQQWPQSKPLGIVLCICSCNSPLGLFVGQIVAALIVGNKVSVKLSSQAILIARFTCQLLYRSGVPQEQLVLLNASDKQLENDVIRDGYINAVMFTGSTLIAKHIQAVTASCKENPVHLIAATDGQNAMIVDSSAVLRHVVDDVLASIFCCTGGNCSSFRAVFIEDSIADDLETMLVQAISAMAIDSSKNIDSHFVPFTGDESWHGLKHRDKECTQQAELVYQCEQKNTDNQDPNFAPSVYRLSSLAELKNLVMGSRIYLLRYNSRSLDSVIKQINNADLVVSCSIYSHINKHIDDLCRHISVSEFYIKQNMCGAFSGFSSSPSKANGPFYLWPLINHCSNEKAQIGAINMQDRNPKKCLLSNPYAEISKGDICWSDLAFRQRFNMLTKCLSIFEKKQFLTKSDVSVIRSMFELLMNQFDQDYIFSTPMGESKTLRLCARGHLIYCLSNGSKRSAVIVNILIALLAGNTLSIKPSTDNKLNDWAIELIEALELGVSMAPSLIRSLDVNADLLTKAEVKTKMAGLIVESIDTNRQQYASSLLECDSTFLPLIDSVKFTELNKEASRDVASYFVSCSLEQMVTSNINAI